MPERVTALCSLCGKEIASTWEAVNKSHKCPDCGHGDLSIVWGEYSGVAEAISQAAKLLAGIPVGDRRRIAQPISDLLPREGES